MTGACTPRSELLAAIGTSAPPPAAEADDVLLIAQYARTRHLPQPVQQLVRILSAHAARWRDTA
ncbi:hypothetical protein C1I98_11405 [Spongiactinospora gelatinilytica]|uniref:Uncharacterized protein n=1 Tax=Spongiactinospora gelatinilytica TaxID=2666298 RepID=A0A2W2GJT3_9ACTN|nr:hypothetical protein [Spongiactinospora gelatinilytica]PZG49786.1 hypothetical protein C1I98_11405 [Spongiactinospora gelatinilytica]